MGIQEIKYKLSDQGLNVKYKCSCMWFRDGKKSGRNLPLWRGEKTWLAAKEGDYSQLATPPLWTPSRRSLSASVSLPLRGGQIHCLIIGAHSCSGILVACLQLPRAAAAAVRKLLSWRGPVPPALISVLASYLRAVLSHRNSKKLINQVRFLTLNVRGNG